MDTSDNDLGITPGTVCMVLPTKDTMYDAGSLVVVVDNVGKGVTVPIYKKDGEYIASVTLTAIVTCEVDVKVASAYHKPTGEKFLSHFIAPRFLMPIEPLADEEEEEKLTITKPKPSKQVRKDDPVEVKLNYPQGGKYNETVNHVANYPNVTTSIIRR